MQAIFFDVDDTLYDQVTPFRNAYKELFGDRYPEVSIDKAFILSRKHSEEVFEATQSGEMTTEELHIYRMQKTMADFGIEITQEEALEFQKIYAEGQKHIEISEKMKEILRQYQGKAKLGIITNGPAAHQWNKIKTLGVDHIIDRKNIIVSGDVNVMKPDKKIFEKAEERLGIDADEMLYIGDSVANDVIGANNAGWKSIWFNRRGITLPKDCPKPTYVVNNEDNLAECLEKLIG